MTLTKSKVPERNAGAIAAIIWKPERGLYANPAIPGTTGPNPRIAIAFADGDTEIEVRT